MAPPDTTVAPPSSAVPSRIKPETVQKAVNALLKWRLSKAKTQKPQLLDLADEDFIYLTLTLKKIPTNPRTNAHRIPLPHALFSPTSELCLIIDDRSNSKLTSDAAKTKLKAENIPVSKVIKLSKLKSYYKPYEAKRKLCNSYDLFFADKRVIPLLPRLLGKQFFKKKKLPLPVDLTHKNWKEQIEGACSSGLLYFRTGSCSVVRVGKASMEAVELVENVVAAIHGVVECVPKKWGGVRSFHVKLSESLALPVYQAVPDAKLKIEGVKEIGEGEVKVKAVEKLGRENVGVKKLVKNKKGRIHDVRYMDGEVGGYEDEFLDDVGDVEGEESEDDDLGGSEFGGKKRKKKGESVV
jgi:ribosome biogenesis protein UTP30